MDFLGNCPFILIQICNPTLPQAIHVNLTPTTGHPAKNSPHKIVSKIRKIAPPMLYSLYHQSLSNTNNPAIIEQLQCPICLNILCQSLELSCRALVCTDCLVHWSMLFNCSEVKSPCCLMQSPIQPQQLKPAPDIIDGEICEVQEEH